MTEERQSSIAPPPSLEEILSSTPESRLGQVDFTSRLAPEPEPESDEDTEVDQTPVDAELPATDSSQADLAPDEPADDISASVNYSDEQALYDELAERAESDRPVPAISEPAVAPGATPVVDPKPTATPVMRESPSPVSPVSPGPELDYVGLSVDEVAVSVVARMREAGEASRRHLESIEAEAARRCELLTAQAELDAELIRLHARREAHAIITAARTRVGGGTATDSGGARLNEIGETFSRFAESIETTVAEAPQSPDHPHRP